MGETARRIGATTFQFFTRNPRGSRAKAIDPADAAALRALLTAEGFGPIVGARAVHHQPLLEGRAHARVRARDARR